MVRNPDISIKTAQGICIVFVMRQYKIQDARYNIFYLVFVNKLHRNLVSTGVTVIFKKIHNYNK